MIKKIHYCWFGHNPIPELNAKCIASWAKFLPDWEVVRWDEDKIDINTCPEFVKKAYEEKKWAFVCDYIRLKALNDYGGLYLDTDMELIKNPENLFDNNLVFGFASKGLLSCEIIYATPNNEIIKRVMNFYENATFDKRKTGLITMPSIVTKILAKNKYIKKNGKYQKTENVITVYPRDYFSPFNPYRMIGQTGITSNTYSIHHFAASWQKREMLVIKLFKKINKIIFKNK